MPNFEKRKDVNPLNPYGELPEQPSAPIYGSEGQTFVTDPEFDPNATIEPIGRQPDGTINFGPRDPALEMPPEAGEHFIRQEELKAMDNLAPLSPGLAEMRDVHAAGMQALYASERASEAQRDVLQDMVEQEEQERSKKWSVRAGRWVVGLMRKTRR